MDARSPRYGNTHHIDDEKTMNSGCCSWTLIGKITLPVKTGKEKLVRAQS
jgi:hypothetical protein